jgi:hypothetical protein
MLAAAIVQCMLTWQGGGQQHFKYKVSRAQVCHFAFRAAPREVECDLEHFHLLHG